MSIGVIGCFRADDGYPNVKYALKCMEEEPGLEVHYLTGIQTGGHFNRLSGEGAAQKIRALLGSIWVSGVGTLRSILAFRKGRIDIIYVPYPGIFSLLAYCIFPRAFRPPIVSDVFISLYDTVVLDRGLFRADSVVGRILFRLEKISLHQLDVATVDTEENKLFLSELFGIELARLEVLPLMIDEECYRRMPVIPADSEKERVKVLFFGSFVPLHGIEVILGAAERLSDVGNIEFMIVGDGQVAPSLESRLLGGKARVDWRRGWMRPEELAELIAKADICLGVFGSGDKAKRVWPLKSYLAMRAGKCVVTGETKVDLNPGGEQAFVALAKNDPECLAQEILSLARSHERREAIGDAGYRLYEERLSNQAATDGLLRIFCSVCPAKGAGPL